MYELEGLEQANDCWHYLKGQLKQLYDKREAGTIASYVFEDLFGWQMPLTEDRTMSPQALQTFSEALDQLLAKRPWQYVVGKADFYGYKFYVNEAVLIPRAETEELVHTVVQQHTSDPALQILDVGTGSGCIAISLKKALPQAQVHAIDISETALAVAQRNADALEAAVEMQILDILHPSMHKQRYTIIVSNPPYILHSEEHLMPGHVLAYEPHEALFVTNDDPLQFYKALLTFAAKQLTAEGYLYVEINEHFGQEVLQAFEAAAWRNCQLLEDFSGRARIVFGQRP